MKKGDRIVLPFAAAVGEEEEVEIADGEMFAEVETECGFLIFEVRIANQKAKGISLSITLRACEVHEDVKWEERTDFSLNEEMQMKVTEANKNNKIYVLDESMPRLPERAQKAEVKQTSIGKKHLEIFNEVDSIKDDGKGGENLRRRREIRRTLSFLRKTDAGLHTEMILTEGGFKQNASYRERIDAANNDNLGLVGGVTKANDKWEGIEGYSRIKNLRLWRNEAAFDDFVINGVWDEAKHGKLLDHFLTEGEKVDDQSAEQLTLIMRNAQATLKVAHGKAWHDVMSTVIDKLENGRLGSVDTAHIKSVVGETWEACSRTLREDDNILSLTVAGTTKSYELDNVQSVVEMFRDRFEGIPETTFESAKRFENRAQREKVTQQKNPGNRVAGKKRDRDEVEETGSKLQITTGKGQPKKLPGANKSLPQRVEFVRGEPKNTEEKEMLCLFDLKHQLLKTATGCLKGKDCNRHHFNSTKLKSQSDYYWTYERMWVHVSTTRTNRALKDKEKEDLLKALKGLEA